MDPLLDLLKKNAREPDAILAKELATTEDDIRARIAAYEAEGVIRLVALEERDLPLGAALLHERREEQTTGAAAYDSNSFRH